TISSTALITRKTPWLEPLFPSAQDLLPLVRSRSTDTQILSGSLGIEECKYARKIRVAFFTVRWFVGHG
ncbi:hypothetical protein CEXT_2591, partial [Caerostris extrusa]